MPPSAIGDGVRGDEASRCRPARGVTGALDEGGGLRVHAGLFPRRSGGAEARGAGAGARPARADAEAYAAALGLRVVRVVRVTERVGMDFFSMMMNESDACAAMNGGAQNEPDIETMMIARRRLRAGTPMSTSGARLLFARRSSRRCWPRRPWPAFRAMMSAADNASPVRTHPLAAE